MLRNIGISLLYFFIIVFIGVVYAMTLRGLPGNPNPKTINTSLPPFETSMERGRYASILSLAHSHTFIVDQYAEFLKPDIAWYNGHYLSAFPPGPVFIAEPLYEIGQKYNLGQVASYAISPIFTLLTVLVTIGIGKKLGISNRATILSIIVFTLASGVWAYSVTLSAHPISAFTISLAFFVTLFIKSGKVNILQYLLLGALFAANFYIDYPNLFILIPLMAYAIFKSWRIDKSETGTQLKIPYGFIFILVTFAITLIPFVKFNQTYFHRPFVLTNTYNLKALEINNVKFSYNHLSDSLFQKKAYTHRFTIDTFPNGAERLLTSADRGLLFFFPIYIFAFLGMLVSYWEKVLPWYLIPLLFLADLLVYGSFDDPHGGWAFGPRYLIPTLPLLSILIGIAFDFIKKEFWTRLIFSFLFIYSSAIALIGALTTNSIPPEIEHIPNTPDNFLLNIIYLFKGNYTSSFLYHQYLMHFITPQKFGEIIFIFIIAIALPLILWPTRGKGVINASASH